MIQRRPAPSTGRVESMHVNNWGKYTLVEGCTTYIATPGNGMIEGSDKGPSKRSDRAPRLDDNTATAVQLPQPGFQRKDNRSIPALGRWL